MANEYTRAHNGYWVYTLCRVNPKTGYRETVSYTGPINKKPKGWAVESKVWNQPTCLYGVTGKHF